MTVLPEIGAGISICKQMLKFMNPAVKARLVRLIEMAKEAKNATDLVAFAEDIGKAYGKIGTGIFGVLRSAGNAEELSTILKVIEAGGKKSYAVLLIGGKAATEFMTEAMKQGVALTGTAGKHALRFGLQYPKLGVRLAKITKTVGWDHFDVAVIAAADLLAKLSLQTTLLAGLAVWLWFHWLDVLGLMVFRSRKQAVA